MVAAALRAATDRLRDASPTPRLDAEVLLAHVIGRERSWLLAHPEADVDGTAFAALIERRASGEPVEKSAEAMPIRARARFA